MRVVSSPSPLQFSPSSRPFVIITSCCLIHKSASGLSEITELYQDTLSSCQIISSLFSYFILVSNLKKRVSRLLNFYKLSPFDRVSFDCGFDSSSFRHVKGIITPFSGLELSLVC